MAINIYIYIYKLFIFLKSETKCKYKQLKKNCIFSKELPFNIFPLISNQYIHVYNIIDVHITIIEQESAIYHKAPSRPPLDVSVGPELTVGLSNLPFVRKKPEEPVEHFQDEG